MALVHAPRDTQPAGIERVSESGRPWADWLGFAGFVGFALWLLSGPRSIALFLAVPVLYELGAAVTFLMRARAKHSVREILPRIAAYASTFLIALFVGVSQRWFPSLIASSPSEPQQLAGATLWLTGSVLGFWPLWYLRGSFSIEPAARGLVTNGPYQLARHPIYASYLLISSGLLVLHFTLAMLVVTGLWFAVTCFRIRFEERVLSDTFPAYAAYRERVGAFGPRLWRSATATARDPQGSP